MGPDGMISMMLGALGILLILGVIFIGVVVWAIKAVRGAGAGDTMKSDEAKLMQELYQGLSKLEERVESLETILLDRKERDR
jgi:phage shock protein B